MRTGVASGLRPRGASATARDEAVCEAEGEGARPAVLESKNVGQPQEAKRKKVKGQEARVENHAEIPTLLPKRLETDPIGNLNLPPVSKG